MAHYSYKNYYQTDLTALKFLACWVDVKPNQRVYYKFYFLLTNIILVTFYNLILTLRWIFVTTNLKEFAEMGYVAINCLMGQTKMLVIFRNSSYFDQLIAACDDNIFQPRNIKELAIIRKVLRNFAKTRRVLKTVTWIAFLGTIFRPLFYQRPYMLPVPAWYPTDCLKSPAFEIAYLHQGISIMYLACSNLYVDVLMAGFATFIGLQCDLLCARLKAVGAAASQTEKKINFIDCILHYNSTFELAGCWAKDSEEIPPFYKYHFYFCNIAVMFAVNFLMTVNWFIETHNLKDASDLGYIILICYMGQAKSYYFYKYRNEFKTLVDMLSDQTFQPRNPEEFESLKIGFQKFWKIKTTMLVLTLISTLCCITTPLISGRLVVRAWYPFELISTIVYCAVYVHQSLAIVLISIINILVDLSIGCFCRFISQQCQLLCMRLVAIANDRDGVCRKKTLLGCIEKHRLMLKFLKTTEKVFGKIYFGQLFASTTALCMDLFLLSLTEPKTFEFFYLVVYLLAVANLLLVPCWFSTEMTRKSENIPFAAYSCDWVDSSNSFKKELIFFIRRAQRPLKFYAVDFFEISVETFVKIIRTSLSYYAVLNNLNMEEKYY